MDSRGSGTRCLVYWQNAMKIMLETTKWSTAIPNHVYVFNDRQTKILGYVPAGSKILHRFKLPLDIDTRGRTFKLLEDEEPGTRSVQGSRGETYYLSKDQDGWICTCPGFKYRGICKHSQEA